MTAPNAEPSAARGPMPLWLVVVLLGGSQIVGYGTIYYAFAILAPGIAREFSVDPAVPFTVLSIALLLAGLTSPFVGRMIDRRGAAGLMATGSVAVAAIYGTLVVAPGFISVALMFILLQVVSTLVLYGGAFPLIAQVGGPRARNAITYLTLISGLASTFFWPLTGWLSAELGWRATMGLFALLHIGIAFPLHLTIAASQRRATRPLAEVAAPRRPAPDYAQVSANQRRFAFWMVAVSFSTTGLLSSALVVHLVPILSQAGLGEATYLVSMIIGPAMLLVRISESLFWKNVHPLVITLLAASCFPLAILFLVIGLPPVIAGVIFAVLYGFGHGLNVIVGGTLPLTLFGGAGYGELLGRLNAVRVVLSAGAPAAFAAAVAWAGFAPTMIAGILIGVVALVPLVTLGLRTGILARR